GRNTKWSLFTGVYSLFYLTVWSFHCEIKAIDPQLQWRYLIWCGWTLLCCLVMYYFFIKKWIYQKQAIALLIFSTLEIGLQIFRYVDRHYFDLGYSQLIYTSGMPTVNNLMVITCYMPLFSSIYKEVRTWIRH
ncbi:hypothetical protein CEX98_11090, partial [Pseudoalteromonas piscicida]